MVAAFLTGRWMEACGQGRFSVTLTDRITNVYVPVVLMVAVLAFVGWSLCGQIGNGILAAVSVVIMACPCALGVAVPAALWMGMAKFSRLRVRVNHAVGLQRLGEADVVVLDKTGTLTEGCSTVTGWLWSHSEESSCKDVLLAADWHTHRRMLNGDRMAVVSLGRVVLQRCSSGSTDAVGASAV